MTDNQLPASGRIVHLESRPLRFSNSKRLSSNSPEPQTLCDTRYRELVHGRPRLEERRTPWESWELAGLSQW